MILRPSSPAPSPAKPPLPQLETASVVVAPNGALSPGPWTVVPATPVGPAEDFPAAAPVTLEVVEVAQAELLRPPLHDALLPLPGSVTPPLSSPALLPLPGTVSPCTVRTTPSASATPPPPTGSPGLHRRSPSHELRVKETLNAYSSVVNGTRTVNQYILAEEIGRGGYAKVERATDRETGKEYAVKEFSKSKLRKIAASEAAKLARCSGSRGRGRLGPRFSVESRSGSLESVKALSMDEQGLDNLALIRKEVAILKKVSHPSICKIHEVIDVSSDNSDVLIVVMELCAGGPVFKIKGNQYDPSLTTTTTALHTAGGSLSRDMGQKKVQEEDGLLAEPLGEEEARNVFRQLTEGIAYLHHNHCIHRDIKPDNICFLEDRKTVKIVDFGISEMFTKDGDDDVVANSVGSPAFMAPELCGGKHDHIHGFACDLWAMGCTLYCLVVGRLPFTSDFLPDLFASINNDTPEIPSHLSPDLQALLRALLQKDAHERPTIADLWNDPWLLASPIPLVPYEENIADPLEHPTDQEMAEAFNALVHWRSSIMVLRAASRFRRGTMARRSLSASGNGDRSSSSGGTPSPVEREDSLGYGFITSPAASPGLLGEGHALARMSSPESYLPPPRPISLTLNPSAAALQYNSPTSAPGDFQFCESP